MFLGKRIQLKRFGLDSKRFCIRTNFLQTFELRLVVALVTLFAAFFDRRKNRVSLGLVSILPFLLFNLFASSFTFTSFFFACFYVGISILVSVLISQISSTNVGIAGLPRGEN